MRYTTIRTGAFFALLTAFLSLPAFGQDARGLALGNCGSGLNWGPSALVWNPAALQYSIPEKGWAISTSASVYDATNTGGAVLDFSAKEASQSNSDPVKKYQSYQGLAAVQMKSAAGGVFYDQETNLQLNQDAADFFADRDSNSLRDQTYGLSKSFKQERIDTFLL